jgi:hypothetical protein
MKTETMNEEFIEEPIDYAGLRRQEQRKIENMLPAERLVNLLRGCGAGSIGYHLAKCILQDVAGEPTTWVGNEHHGWDKLVFNFHNKEIILSPNSGPDGLGDWYIV